MNIPLQKTPIAKLKDGREVIVLSVTYPPKDHLHGIDEYPRGYFRMHDWPEYEVEHNGHVLTVYGRYVESVDGVNVVTPDI